MICCICGVTLLDSDIGCNPWPLAGRHEHKVCCNDCDKLVNSARRMQRFNQERFDTEIKVGDNIAIFWSQDSTIPTEFITKNKEFLRGKVEKIIKRKGSIYYCGSWGSFRIAKTDEYAKTH